MLVSLVVGVDIGLESLVIETIEQFVASEGGAWVVDARNARPKIVGRQATVVLSLAENPETLSASMGLVGRAAIVLRERGLREAPFRIAIMLVASPLGRSFVIEAEAFELIGRSGAEILLDVYDSEE
jgi:hypothetical protein